MYKYIGNLTYFSGFSHFMKLILIKSFSRICKLYQAILPEFSNVIILNIPRLFYSWLSSLVSLNWNLKKQRNRKHFNFCKCKSCWLKQAKNSTLVSFITCFRITASGWNFPLARIKRICTLKSWHHNPCWKENPSFALSNDFFSIPRTPRYSFSWLCLTNIPWSEKYLVRSQDWKLLRNHFWSYIESPMELTWPY